MAAAGDYTEFDTKKRVMLIALEKSLGVVSTAARAAKITRATHYNWLNENELYKKAVSSISDVALDFAETQLFKSIRTGSDAATIFYLKTKGKERGYIERQEVTGKDGDPLLVAVSDKEAKEIAKAIQQDI